MDKSIYFQSNVALLKTSLENAKQVVKDIERALSAAEAMAKEPDGDLVQAKSESNCVSNPLAKVENTNPGPMRSVVNAMSRSEQAKIYAEPDTLRFIESYDQASPELRKAIGACLRMMDAMKPYATEGFNIRMLKLVQAQFVANESRLGVH